MLLVPAAAFALPVQSGGPSGPVKNHALSNVNLGFGCHMELGQPTAHTASNGNCDPF